MFISLYPFDQIQGFSSGVLAASTVRTLSRNDASSAGALNIVDNGNLATHAAENSSVRGDLNEDNNVWAAVAVYVLPLLKIVHVCTQKDTHFNVQFDAISEETEQHALDLRRRSFDAAQNTRSSEDGAAVGGVALQVLRVVCFQRNFRGDQLGDCLGKDWADGRWRRLRECRVW